MNRLWQCVREMKRGPGGGNQRRIARPGERGQGMLEYAIISGVIIVGTVAVLSALAGSLNHIFSTISTTLGQY